MRKITGILFFLAPLFAYSQNISIANTTVIEGNGEQTVEVMVLISPAAETDMDVSYKSALGSGTLHFKKGETMKKIPVTIKGDQACTSDKTIDITLSNATAGTITDPVGTVKIIDDDCLKAARIGTAAYEIRLTCTGYTSFSVGPPDCPIRANGKVVLYGIVEGKENVAFGDDINYRGTMQLDIDMDECSTKRDPNSGEDKLCGMTINGSGPVDVDLEVRFDSRGGYIKFENKSGRYIRSIKGGCDPAEMAEEFTMIPNKTIVSIFNGFELPSLTNKTLTVGTYRDESGVELKVVTEVLRKIR